MAESSPTKISSPLGTLVFMMILSLICAVILSIIASALAEPKEIARELDRSKQMLIASKVLSHEGYFQIKDKDGAYGPALVKNGYLVADSKKVIPSSKEILEIYNNRLVPLLANHQGGL